VLSTSKCLGGAGGWLVEKHGTSRRRSWRKLHVGVDAQSGEIVASPSMRRMPPSSCRHGHRMGWQKSSGYNLRARVESSIGRYKRVIGDALRSRTDETEATEVAIAAAGLNRMLKFGRPS
jgi:hypothetical protein